MRKTAFLLLTAFMLVPAAMFGDSYSKLWKQVDEAANKDLPKTQIQLLQAIADKAEAGGDYGHLLKAETCMASVWYSISPDSLPSKLARLEDKAEACSKSDGALSAVYYAALGKIYSSYRNFSPYAAVGIDNSAKAAEFSASRWPTLRCSHQRRHSAMSRLSLRDATANTSTTTF